MRVLARRGRGRFVAGALSLALGATACGARLFVVMKEESLGEGARAVLGGGGNSFVLLHGADAFLVDTKFGDFGLRLEREVEVELGHRVRRILLTHSHLDHAGGLHWYGDAGAVLAHPNTRARLEADAQGAEKRPSWGAAWVEVENEVRLLLGGEGVWVRYLGPAHTDGDLVAFLPKRRLLVAGDLFLAGTQPLVDDEAHGTIRGTLTVLERMLEMPFERVVPGHGEVVGRGEMERVRDYVKAMEAGVREVMARGGDEEAAARSVTLDAFDDLRPVPFIVGQQEANVRRMFRELGAEKGVGK